LQVAPRRVKTIYSVIASPNRLEILRILNTKGPLSYSELKTLAGFKSKKESGKFAYHLRKLVRQTLISLNRSERKYVVTNLGRLVLNLTRQIEEQSVLESGKLYVRTSRQAMEEFNADKILQSLVKEAGMPVELAQKITSETESRIYKFQTTYLTAPLIREIVNSILVEHGYEEYRHRLTRVGLPIYDVTELIRSVGESTEGTEALISQTGHSVFSEYLLLTEIPRDVSDAHLSGDIQISNLGSWGLVPDTMFLNLLSVPLTPASLGSKLPTSPRISEISNLDDAAAQVAIQAQLLSRECANEVCLEGIVPFLGRYANMEAYRPVFAVVKRLFRDLSSVLQSGIGSPVVSFRLNTIREPSSDLSLLESIRVAVLQAYTEYLQEVPAPPIRLIVPLDEALTNDALQSVCKIIDGGIPIALTRGNEAYSYSGLRKPASAGQLDGSLLLQCLSMNLPRLAYESNKDETYFRAKLAILAQTCLTALSTRRRIIQDRLKGGLLPAISSNPALNSLEEIPITINLVGLFEAISALVTERASATLRREVERKVLETAFKVVTERGEKIGESAHVSMIEVPGVERLGMLDEERYGRHILSFSPGAISPSSSSGTVFSYSQGVLIDSASLSDSDYLDHLRWCQSTLDGGCSLTFDLGDQIELIQIPKVFENLPQKFSYLKVKRYSSLCKKCGSRIYLEGSRCKNCRSATSIKVIAA
jgi:hypothetical protein